MKTPKSLRKPQAEDPPGDIEEPPAPAEVIEPGHRRARAARLDKATPKWPELRATFGDTPSIVIAGVSRRLDSQDPQRDAVMIAAAEARDTGHPIRMTATAADGSVRRLIVDHTATVVVLDHARKAPTSTRPPTALTTTANSNKPPARTRKSKPAKRKALRVPKVFRPLQPRHRRALFAVVGALTGLLLITATWAIINRADTRAAPVAPPPVTHPAPPAGQLRTELPPPGWSAQAAWTVPIAADAHPVTDPDTGITAVLTPNDRTTDKTATATASLVAAHAAGFLSVLDPAGRTLWAEPMTSAPSYGPVITTIGNARVIAISADGQTLTWWPLAGGKAVTAALPDGVAGQLNNLGGTLMATLDNDRVSVIGRGGTWQTIQLLPRTTPVLAAAGGVISVQPETGAWWTQQLGAAPTSVQPQKPSGAVAVDQIIALTPTRVLISWTTATQNQATVLHIISAHDQATGKLLTQTTTEQALGPARAIYTTPGITTADTIVLAEPGGGRPPSLILTAGFAPTAAAAGTAYGTDTTGPVAINATGKLTTLTPATLTPTNLIRDHLLVLSASHDLYALTSAQKAGR